MSLEYDAFARKIKNLAGTSFLYNGANAIQELSGSTVTANLLSGGVDEIFTRSDSSSSFTPLKDALGSTIALVDSSGTVQTSYIYNPFGGTSVTGSSNSNEFQYTGRENEGNGLYFYRNRYYSPLLGRFISEDPAADGLNFYAYADDDPIDFSDPFGLAAAPATAPVIVRQGIRIVARNCGVACRGMGWGGLAAVAIATVGLVRELDVAEAEIDWAIALHNRDDAEDQELWALDRLNQDRLNKLLVQQKLLAGRYTQKDIDYKEYKKRCGQPAPAGLGICGKMIWSQQRNLDCRDMRQIWDDKYSPGEHAKDIRDLTVNDELHK